ncbi:MAG: YfhO family protein [Erysipelotrichaceae bacterium]
MLNVIKNNYKLYITVSIITIIAFVPFIIFNNGIIIFHGDSYEQIYKMWLGGYEMFRTNSFSFFNWTIGFGTNIFANAFYLLFDFTFYISLLFSKEFIPYFITISTVMIIIIGFIFTHLWLTECNGNGKASFIGSLVIVFSGYMFFMLQYYQYHKFLIFYPIILYLTEIYLKRNKFTLLCIMIGLLGISNYYLLYQFIPFLLLYTLFRYLVLMKEKIHFKTLVIDGLKYLFIVFIGIAISAVVLLPSLYLISTMPRFTGESINFLSTMSGTQLFKIFSSLFTPVLDRHNANYFINVNHHASLGWGGGTSLYSLAIVPLLFPILIKNKKTFEQKLLICFYGLMCTFIFFKGFSLLFQMNMETRWFFMIVYLNGYMVANTLTQIRFTKKDVKLSCLLIIIIILNLLLISYMMKFSSTSEFRILIIIVIFTVILTILCSVALCNEDRDRILTWILAINIIACGWFFYWKNIPVKSEYINSEVQFDETINTIDDDSFYRVLFDKYVEDDFYLTKSNEPYSHNFKGAGFYSSVYNANQEDFLARFKSTWNMPQIQGRTSIYNLLSFKYWYTYQHNEQIPFAFELKESYENGMQLYENTNFFELGFIGQNTINEEVVKNLSFFEQDRIMRKYIVSETSRNMEYKIDDHIIHLATLPQATVRVYDFNEDISDSRIYIETYGIPNILVETYRDKVLVEKYDFWQFNYIDFYVEDPIDQIVIIGEDIYGQGTQIELYIENNLYSYTEEFAKLTEDSFDSIQFTNDNIKTEINSELGGLMFTSIPYDKGWHIFVDGEKIEYERVNFGFIGFHISPGYHEIEFKYKTPYLKEGSIITVTALILLGILKFIQTNRQQN